VCVVACADLSAETGGAGIAMGLIHSSVARLARLTSAPELCSRRRSTLLGPERPAGGVACRPTRVLTWSRTGRRQRGDGRTRWTGTPTRNISCSREKKPTTSARPGSCSGCAAPAGQQPTTNAPATGFPGTPVASWWRRWDVVIRGRPRPGRAAGLRYHDVYRVVTKPGGARLRHPRPGRLRVRRAPGVEIDEVAAQTSFPLVTEEAGTNKGTVDGGDGDACAPG